MMFETGNRVIDQDGNRGNVVNADDLHNIEVDYYSGGKGFYCIDPECRHYDPIKLVDENETEANN